MNGDAATKILTLTCDIFIKQWMLVEAEAVIHQIYRVELVDSHLWLFADVDKYGPAFGHRGIHQSGCTQVRTGN